MDKSWSRYANINEVMEKHKEDPVPAKKKKEKKQKTEDSAEKKHKEKKHEKEKGEKKKDKEKKEKKEKEKEKNKEEKKEKKEKKEQKEGKEHEVQIKFAPAPEPPRKIGPQAFPPEALEQKDKKQKKEKKEHKRHASMAGPAAVREVMLCSASAFKDKSRPFGIELDGALVVDLADEGVAIPAGIQIGWRILEVDGKAVPEEEVGKATKVLREAEEKMANRSGKASVSVSFLTEEPDHWKQAAKALSGRR